LTFVGPDNVPRSTQTGAGGEFTISGLAVGFNKVTVVPVRESGLPPREPAKKHDSATGGQRLSRQHPAAQEVPSQYGDAAHPRLTYTLATGDNVLDIDLTTPTK
jgi:hypothetical protein